MTKFTIIKELKQEKGILFTVKVGQRTLNFRFTYHSLNRIKRWELKNKQVLECLLYPEEVLAGHNERFIAHRRYSEHILRAVYEYEEDIIVVVTVYSPYIERYFKGGGTYADKIFS